MIMVMAQEIQFPEQIERYDATKPLMEVDQLHGGYWQVEDTIVRNAIPIEKRVQGMIVSWQVSGNWTTNRFDGVDTTNTEWIKWSNWNRLALDGDTINSFIQGSGVDNQIAVFNAGKVIEGSPNFTWDSTTFIVIGADDGTGKMFLAKGNGGTERVYIQDNGYVYIYPPVNDNTDTKILMRDVSTGLLETRDVSSLPFGTGTVTGTGVAGRATYWTASGAIGSDANYLWSSANELFTLRNSGTGTDKGFSVQSTGSVIAFAVLKDGSYKGKSIGVNYGSPYNTFLGRITPASLTGTRNVGVGSSTMVNLTSGFGNASLGANSGNLVTNQSQCTYLGAFAGYTNTTSNRGFISTSNASQNGEVNMIYIEFDNSRVGINTQSVTSTFTSKGTDNTNSTTNTLFINSDDVTLLQIKNGGDIITPGNLTTNAILQSDSTYIQNGITTYNASFSLGANDSIALPQGNLFGHVWVEDETDAACFRVNESTGVTAIKWGDATSNNTGNEITIVNRSGTPYLKSLYGVTKSFSFSIKYKI